jgi:hypothetical protein
MRAYGEGPQRFSGTIKVPGGIKDVQTYRLEGSDKFELNGDTITFDILSSEETLGPNKHIQITPAPGADTMTVEIRVNGKIMPGRFFPYGTEVSEPTCAATVKLDSFPLGPELPMTEVGQPAGCYLWGAVGRQGQGEAAQLDEQTKAQLRALGYVN